MSQSRGEKGVLPIAREDRDPVVTKTASAVGKSLFEPSQSRLKDQALVATLLEQPEF